MQKKRGRPAKSDIRQNIVEIVHQKGTAYGYEICKLYHGIFHSATKRVIYYHLQKGVELEIFRIDKIKKEDGEFSWGNSAEKTYYRLGPQAKPKGIAKVSRFFGNNYL